MNSKRTILENKIRNIVKSVLREASPDTGFQIEYYETYGQYGTTGKNYYSLESAVSEGKKHIKDSDFMGGVEYVGVIGYGGEPKFAVLYCKPSYLKHLDEFWFDSPQDFAKFRNACQKVIDTGKPVKGKFT